MTLVSPTEVGSIVGIVTAILVPSVGWWRERGREKVVTQRAEVGVDADMVALARGMLEEQRTIHAQEVAYIKMQRDDCWEREKQRAGSLP